MPIHPRIVSLSTASPHFTVARDEMLAFVYKHLLGDDWAAGETSRQQARQIERTVMASTVETRQLSVDIDDFYARPRSTGERMATYVSVARALGRNALEACLCAAPGIDAASLTDLTVVSCTGYAAPGVDILLSRDLGLNPDVRRIVVGHMGCFGALAGMRQLLATMRAYPKAVAALLCVEISSIHFSSSADRTVLSLFGDGAAALLLTNDQHAAGPEVVDAYSVADFGAANQMTWEVGDEGFIMGLSPRVPVTLRRQVRAATERLLAPHGLNIRDVTHWLVHPGGPSILEAIADKLELADEQLAHSWKVLREHGNCSSATVLMVLEEAIKSGATHRGEWGVMMAFGPGLTLELCLLRF
ncbi:MAG TPA: type III polyketide synthase [Ktedonobacterales bacterium]|nr:type III polyketide synthase [Ktedonobacterales bacterium]